MARWEADIVLILRVTRGLGTRNCADVAGETVGVENPLSLCEKRGRFEVDGIVMVLAELDPDMFNQSDA